MTNEGAAANPLMGGAEGLRESESAQRLLEALRRGELPASDEARRLHSATVIGNLRRLVEPSDLERLLPLIEADDEKLAGLCISILAAHSCDPRVQDALRKAWPRVTPHIRSVLMWRLLDDPDLPRSWHEKLLEFVLAEPEVFHANCLRFFGGTEETMIAFVRERYSSAQIPDTKKWAYLCSMAGIQKYPVAAAAIIRMGLASEDDFTAGVAKRLLETRPGT